MRTSSSSRIIKPDMGLDIKKFIPSAHTEPQPADREAAAQREDGVVLCSPKEQEENEMLHKVADIINGAKEEARQIMMKANQIAESIIAEAEQEKSKAIEAGYQEGYEKGRQEGFEKADREQNLIRTEQKEAFRREIEEAVAAVDRAKEKSISLYMEELKDCVIAVAEKVIHISLKSSGDVIRRMLIAETEKLKKKVWVKIYMDKTDYDMMIEADGDMLGELTRLSDNIKFVVMNKENSGNCIIEMPEEIIDISVDTQMENIRELLENIRF
ncbi:MAG: flagellar biosynthesis/type III secretory pathway protein [Clostridiales bacterium]|nr:flagellar biosynthesis/type III secretory pathway protein [Clostridiales bacterium]